MTKIRILIADDHALVRDGLKALMGSQPDLEVVGEVGDAPSVAKKTAEVTPDVVILDIGMPGGGGMATIAEVLRANKNTRVVVLSIHESQRYVRRALEMGASAYIPKREAASTLLDAIRQAHVGQPTLAADGTTVFPGRRPGPRPTSELSPREREVLEMVASGLTNRETADRLGVSIKTVEGYRARLMRKIGATSRADLVRHAILLGLLEVHAAAVNAAG